MISGFGASGFQASGQVLFEPRAEGSRLCSSGFSRCLGFLERL